MKILNIFYQLKNFLFPASCALCGRELDFAAEIRLGLCQECSSGITLEEGKKCNLCGKPLVSEIETCLPCRNSEDRSFLRLWLLFPYTGKYRKLLTEYKFKKNLSLAGLFAEKIKEVIKNEPLLKDAVFVPVPPRPGKIKEAGWDQVEYLIKKLGKSLPVSRCLKRRKSKVQKTLSRKDRMENLKGRIYINGAPPKTALIIDDVITTGSTIEVCAKTLMEAGAQKVYGLCLFYD
ncbi:MAG: ComF family protein [Treponema sp.]|nr:ComF family protein [Treponema sp.]